MKRSLVMLLGLYLVLLFASTVFADENRKDYFVKCPVCQSEQVDAQKFMDVEGYRFFFCCDGCKEKFSADPNSYIQKIQKDGYALLPVEKAKEITLKSQKEHECTGDCKDGKKDHATREKEGGCCSEKNGKSECSEKK